LILGGLGFSQAYATSSFTGLGDLPGGEFFSFGIAVSDDGSVVVVNSFSDNGLEGAKWTAAGGLVPIPALLGGEFPEVFPTAVSGDGTVIVGSSTSANGFNEAFRWTEDGGTVGLGDLPDGGFCSNATGVSEDGSVIVGTGCSEIGSEAFRWTEDGGMVGLDGGLDDRKFTFADDVTNDGTLVVGTSDSFEGVATIWTEMDGARLIDDTSLSFNAISVSSSDETVIAGPANSDGGQIAVKWTEETGAVLLGALPDGIGSFAFDISPDGSIIVGSSTSNSGGTAAFIWDEENGMRNLQQVLEDDFELDLTGWDLTAALGVTSNGSITVTGEGTNPDGDFEGWVAVMELEPPLITCGLDTELLDSVCVVTQELRDQITGLQASLATAVADLVAALATIVAQDETIAAQDTTIAGLEATIIAQDATIADQDANIAELVTNEIIICHNKSDEKTVSVGALGQHLDHGDTRGPC